jgi:hypothetical protein
MSHTHLFRLGFCAVALLFAAVPSVPADPPKEPAAKFEST